MSNRKPNDGYHETAYRLAYDIENNVFEPTPQRFRFKSKDGIVSNEQNVELMTNWLATSSDRTILTDSDLKFKAKDKILFSLQKNDLNEYIHIAEITRAIPKIDPQFELNIIRNRYSYITTIELEK